jgi:LacI family transcriptional regulator
MKKQENLVGVKEIARRANVSIGTVDRVLNNRTGVSVKTKENILAIMKELDYQPNVIARRLASKKLLRIASLIPSSSTETGYWELPLKGIQQAAEETRALGVVIDEYFFNQNDKKTFTKKAKEIFKTNYDGILLAPMFEEEAQRFVAKCEQQKIPYAFINSDLSDTNRICYIGPDLFQSGYLAAHLSSYLLNKHKSALIVNISRELDIHHHLLVKEHGFKSYFANKNIDVNIVKTDIRESDYESIKRELQKLFRKHQFDVVFVSNSRVFNVAKFLQEKNISDVKLIGYDFLPQNIAYLKQNLIDFLICQKPQEQGYKGIMSLYQHLVSNTAIEKEQFMPIDIISTENLQYYRN